LAHACPVGVEAVLLFAIAFQGIRKLKTEGWLAIPALLLAAGSLYQRELHVFLHVRTTFQTAGAYCPSRNHPRDVVAHPDNGHVAAAFSRNYSSP
jgi:hypothetical protein